MSLYINGRLSGLHPEDRGSTPLSDTKLYRRLTMNDKLLLKSNRGKKLLLKSYVESKNKKQNRFTKLLNGFRKLIRIK